MKDTKRLALRFFLAAELVVVTFFYLFSSGGLQALRREDVSIGSYLQMLLD